MDGVTASTAELNILDGVTATTAELNIMDGVTATTAELNIMGGVTATTAELNILDGLTSTTAELNTTDGIDTAGTGFGYVPQGGIIMWSGSIISIPSGWLICDGTSSTPDLRNRFVVGAGSTYAVDATGGADTVALTGAELAAHVHSFSATTSGAGAHSHTGVPQQVADTDRGIGNVSNFNLDAVGSTDAVGNHTHTISGSTGNAGSGNAHENRPPYYALAYIMKA